MRASIDNQGEYFSAFANAGTGREFVRDSAVLDAGIQSQIVYTQMLP
jgi:hypothetical protein